MKEPKGSTDKPSIESLREDLSGLTGRRFPAHERLFSALEELERLRQMPTFWRYLGPKSALANMTERQNTAQETEWSVTNGTRTAGTSVPEASISSSPGWKLKPTGANMPKGEEHEARKTYRPGETYRPRDPFFQRQQDQDAQEAAEAFIRAAYAQPDPSVPNPMPKTSLADLDMWDRLGCAPAVLAYPLSDAAFLALIHVKEDL